jgi:hypothetical protein
MNPDPDVTKVRNPCGSGSTTLNVGIGIESGIWFELGSGFLVMLQRPGLGFN